MKSGEKTVLTEYEGESYWMPVPNSGTKVTLKVSDKNFNDPIFHSGMHHMPPGATVPEHFHQAQMEVIFCHRGSGKLTVDGKVQRLETGGMVCISNQVKHSLENDTDEELVIFWVITPPGGLIDYFRDIGKACDGNDFTPPPQFSADRTDNAEVQKKD